MEERKRNRGETGQNGREKAERQLYRDNGKKSSKRNEGRLHAIHCKTPNHKVSFKGTKLGKENNNTVVKYNSSVAQL